MTREEEIKEAAEKRTLEIFGELDDFQDRTDGFIEGAKWADKTMINKACEIAKDILSSYSFANYPREIQNFLVDFRKAMEE